MELSLTLPTTGCTGMLTNLVVGFLDAIEDYVTAGTPVIFCLIFFIRLGLNNGALGA